MKISVIQLGYDDQESPAARTERAAGLVAAQQAADLVILPELWAPTGFGYAAWASNAEPLDGPWAATMRDAAIAAGCTLHAGSFVERLQECGPEGKALANTSVVFGADGELLGMYRKIHLFGFSAGEPELMEPGPEIVLVDIDAVANTPGGDQVTAGLSTCYDLRFPELYREQIGHGATMFLVPAAWPSPRVEHWRLLGRARAVENQSFVVQCNTAGQHAGTAMGGHSQVVSPSGVVLGELAHADEGVLTVEVDLSEVAAYREAFPVLADRRI